MTEHFDLTIFELSPISMWLQDFSGVKKIFQRWKDEGVEDFEAFLHEDLSRLNQCLATIQTLCVNQSTLDLYEAKDLNEILDNFIRFLTPEVTTYQIKFFCALWNNQHKYAIPVVNYTCKGNQIDIQLSANIVTGYEDSWELLLLTTEHISDYQNARRFAESIFLHSPTALWVKDYSAIKTAFDLLKQKNVVDLQQHIHHHPEFVQTCFELIQTKQMNEAFLSLFKATSRANFVQHMAEIYPPDWQEQFKNQLLLLSHIYDHPSEFEYETESQYLSLDGASIDVIEKLNIFPDSNHSWGTIQIAYTDFTERKKLQNHLHYVSKHDQLTQLYNRTFFIDEVERLERLAVSPLTCIYLDINGLKQINDSYGHYYGDALLKRFASILMRVTLTEAYSVSRIGGDEFVILMPYADEHSAQVLIEQIELKITEHNTQLYSLPLASDVQHNTHIRHHAPISVASGIASTQRHCSVEQLIKLADQNMYRKKRNHYEVLTTTPR